MYIIKAIIDNIEQYYCGEIYKESEIEFNSDINLATKFSVYFIVNLKVNLLYSLRSSGRSFIICLAISLYLTILFLLNSK